LMGCPCHGLFSGQWRPADTEARNDANR
jgi:hypothetical protein